MSSFVKAGDYIVNKANVAYLKPMPRSDGSYVFEAHLVGGDQLDLTVQEVYSLLPHGSQQESEDSVKLLRQYGWKSGIERERDLVQDSLSV